MEITATIKKAGNVTANVNRPGNVNTEVTRLGGASVTVDPALDGESTNPVENKAIVEGLAGKQDAALIVTTTPFEYGQGIILCTLSETYANIRAAIHAGRDVYVWDNGDHLYPYATELPAFGLVFGTTVCQEDTLYTRGVLVMSTNYGAYISTSKTIPSIPEYLSAFINDVGYITSADVPVTSVNSMTGEVMLSAADVGALPDSTPIPVVPADVSAFNNDAGYVDAAGAAAAAPVQSVNGQTGTVSLTIPTVPTDVSAFNNDAHYLHGNTKGVFYGVSTTTASTAEKAVTCAEFTSADKAAGAVVFVMIGHTNTASVDDVKLNVNSTGARAIRIMENGALAKLPSADYLQTAMVYPFYFDGDYWVCLQNHTPKNVSELNNDSGFVTASTAPVTSVNGSTGAVTGLQPAGDYASSAAGDTTHTALKAAGIMYGECDNTSTSTAFTATVAGVTSYYDGLTILLYNGVVTSASGFTININGLGALPSYNNMTMGNPVTPTNPTRDTTIFNINYAMLITYSSIVSGGCWIMYRGYDANTNTIAYQVRTNNTSLDTVSRTRYYRLLFTSADNTEWVPANTSYDNSATSVKTVNQTKINPFGRIVYMSGTTNVSAGGAVGASVTWDLYNLALGYSFNRTGSALTLTTKKPVYVVCAPQTDGSAIMDSATPIVQDLPTTNDGKIYIYLGIAYSATNIELTLNHPVYYHNGNGIRLWTGGN